MDKIERENFWQRLHYLFFPEDHAVAEDAEERIAQEKKYVLGDAEILDLEDSASMTYRYKPMSKYTHINKKSDKLIDKLDALVVKKKLFLDPQLSLTKLGVMLGVNRTYMSSILREKNGFKIYVNTLRLKYFCSLMQEFEPTVRFTKKAITKMALRSGFSDLRTFKRLVFEGDDPWSAEIKRRIYSPLKELEEAQIRQLDRMAESENLPQR